MKKKNKKFIPTIAIKIFRDGHSSSSILAIWSFEQSSDSFHYFKHDLASQIPEFSKQARPELQFGAKRFAKLSRFPFAVGTSHLATMDSVGKKVEKPKFPFMLILHPTKETKALFSEEFKTSDLYELLAPVRKSPQVLFELYGVPEPNEKPIKIGIIETTSEMIKSAFGDMVLFFQHHRFEEDLEKKPEWEKSITERIESEKTSDKPLHWGDID